MTRILVTAALGNVGREVALSCAALGMTVRATDRDEAKVRAQFPLLEAAALDFFDRRTWAPALLGCDYVFLLRPPPVGDMKTTLCPFLDLAYASGVKHVVFLSVARADEMKWVPHRKVELHLMKSAGAWTVLRPGFFAQNLQDAYRRDIVEDDRIYVPAGRGRVAFIDVADIGAVAARIFAEPAPHTGKFLTLTGPAAITFEEVVGTLSAVLERPIRYDAASIAGYAWHLRSKRGLSLTQLTIQTILHVGLRSGDAERVEPTVANILGREPRGMPQYIRDSAAIWRR